jgi:hypothetical protein
MAYTVPVSTQPEPAPVVAQWLVAEFGRPGGRTEEELTALILSTPVGLEDTFVPFDQKRPVVTASLAHEISRRNAICRRVRL